MAKYPIYALSAECSKQPLDVYRQSSVDGLALAQFIHLKSQPSLLPIIMVSSQSNEANLSNGQHAGIDALCDKPFEPRLIKNIFYQLLEKN